MTHRSPKPLLALAAAIDLPDSAEAPEWVHLLPAAKGEIQTYDGRGPYRVEDLGMVIAASLHSERGMPIDENHATDLALASGGSAPARGWIEALESRADGLWGRVRWTKAGAAMMADRAYRGISPVFNHTSDGVITRLLRASLTNKPNLKGLIALNTETDMNFAAIAKAAGLGDDATETAIIAAIGAMKPAGNATALQSALTEIGAAFGVESSDPAAVVAAAKTAKTTDGSLTALQAELTAVTGQLNSLQTEGAKTRATTFVDGEIAKGRVGVKPLRDHYIAMHAQDAARVEKEIGALPILGPQGSVIATPPATGAEITSLNAEQTQAASLLGLSPETYLKALNDGAKKETF